MRRPNAKQAAVAVVIGAASLTGAGFGIANAMTPSTPPPAMTHQQAPHSGGVDTPEAGDTPDTPDAVDAPQAGDTPDTPGAVDRPEAGDIPDAPGQN